MMRNGRPALAVVAFAAVCELAVVVLWLAGRVDQTPWLALAMLLAIVAVSAYAWRRRAR